MQKPKGQDIEDHLCQLIESINPHNAEIMTKKVIILTSPSPVNLHKLLPAFSFRPRIDLQNVPYIMYKPDSHNVSSASVVNAGCCFPDQKTKGALESVLNMVYLLTFYEEVKMMIVITQQQALDPNGKVIVDFLAKIKERIDNEEFSKYIGFIVTSAKQSEEKYAQNIQNLLKKKEIENKLNGSALLLLKSLSKKKFILVNQNNKAEQIIQLIDKKYQDFKATPKRLTALYKKLIPESVVNLFAKDFYNIYSKKIVEFTNTLKKLIDQKQFQIENDKQSKEQAEKRILEASSFKQLAIKIDKILPANKKRKVNHFVLQSAFFIFVELFKTEDKFYAIQKSYLNYNTVNQKADVDNVLEEKSLFGTILQNFFNQNTLLHSNMLIALSKYIQIFFRIFQCFPNSEIRKVQSGLLPHLQEIISSNFVDYFVEQTHEVVKQVLSKNQPPIKIIGLINDINQLINKFSEMSKKQKAPFLDKSKQVSQKSEIILISYVEVAWRCYDLYDRFWSKGKKNKFMLDMDKIFRNQQHFEYLNNYNSELTNKIIKKICRYFGDFCFSSKKYFFAIQFYNSAKINSKVIETYQKWLGNMLESLQFNQKCIQQGINKLAGLGMVEQARRWCYKFIQVLDNNSFLISILHDIIDYSRDDNSNMLAELQRLKYNAIYLIKEQLMKEVRNQISTQEWLPDADL